MLNRAVPPPSGSISQFHISKAESLKLSNGLDLHVINAGNHDILQLEVIMRSGKWYETINGISLFTAKMLTEGTSRKSSAWISEFFESYGAQLDIHPGIDLVTVSAVFLNKHLAEIIPVLKECLFDPAFSESELATLKDIQVQEIKVNNEKGSYLASKEFRKLIFGYDHPYGRSLETEDINEQINAGMLRNYHRNNFFNGMEIILTGHKADSYFNVIEKEFGPSLMTDAPGEIPGYSKAPLTNRSVNIPKPGSLQTSVRYGKSIVNKKHPDYPGLLVLNELLGGFFGSRLMKNIREEKGYTYGIYSSLNSNLSEGYFVIGADLIKEYTHQAIGEINKEIQRLQSELVGGEELETVRNYMLGSFLSSLETSFSLTEKFKSVYFYGLGYDYYDRYISTINNISPEELRDLAQKYLNINDFGLVIVGLD